MDTLQSLYGQVVAVIEVSHPSRAVARPSTSSDPHVIGADLPRVSINTGHRRL